jgi:hypothetical protein
MYDTSTPRAFRHAVLAVAIAFVGQHRGIPDAVRTGSQRIALRVMKYLDERRLKRDQGAFI